MCIIVDVNTIPVLFNADNKQHSEYRPVLEWIVADKGKIVYGGSKYKEELKELKGYFRFIKILEQAGKTHEVDDLKVNEAHEIIKTKQAKKEFNDPHIIAIISICGCKLLCSNDHASFPFIKKKEFYLNDQKPPAIYTRKDHKDLLIDDNIASCCRPCCKGSRELKKHFGIS